MDFLLTDTVGFLRDLPHHLIEAFRSTLESALQCDLALIVCDAGGDYEVQLETTLKTLRSMDFSSPYLVVMNKCDQAQENTHFPKDWICISAKYGRGLVLLKQRIFESLERRFIKAELFVPYANASKYAALRSLVTEREVSYTDDGSHILAVIPAEHAAKFRPYLK